MNMTQTALVPPLRSIPSEVSVLSPQAASPPADIRCIAHDLNNSVQATLSTLQLVQARLLRGLTDEIPKLIAQAVVSAALASKTGKRLMSASQSTPGASTNCAVKGLVGSMEPLLKHVLGSTSNLILAFDSASPTVACEPSRLQNALLNLVLNAKDAMPAGGTVVVSVSRTENACEQVARTPRHYVRIVVTDTGHGMTKEVLSRACTEFFTTKPSGKGSGLGLSTVKSFVEELDGSLDIQSASGCGTSISILLPCADVDDQKHSPA
jgi:signal transduction histidine kinase